MPARIFVSYRRDDDPNGAARVGDGLAAKFGKASVFMDVDNLLAGQRFDEELAKALAQCDVLIAIIGPRWMDLLRARLASGERDYVREEIGEALAAKLIVIPVRVGREGQLPALPRREELPEDIRDLALYQKHDVAHERFGRDIAELIEAIVTIRRTNRPQLAAPRVPWGWVGATAASVLAIGYAAAYSVGVPVWVPFAGVSDPAGLTPATNSTPKTPATRTVSDPQGLTPQQAAQAQAEREAKLIADAEQRIRDEIEAKQRADAEAKRKADEAAAAKAKAEADARAKAAAEAEAKRVAAIKAEEDRKAAAEAKRLADLASAEERRKAEVAARAKAEADARAKAAAEAEAKRVAAIKAEEDRKAAAEAKRLADLAAAEERRKAEVAAGAKAEAEARTKAAAEVEAKRVVALKAEEDRKAAAEAKRLADLAAAEERRKAEARFDPATTVKPGSGQTFRDCNDGCPEMVVVPAGKFMMGEGERVREVAIAQPFAVGKFEVTFDEWAACVAAGGCTSNRTPNDYGWGKGRRPVVGVSWNDAKEYVAWLARKTGQPYRLLSGAEWEYAARANTATMFSWGNPPGRGNANCDGCGSKWDKKQTAPVGSFKPNAWGLHDMHGNVGEWCEDAYDATARVQRGGGWFDSPFSLRASLRLGSEPTNRHHDVGFRLARML